MSMEQPKQSKNPKFSLPILEMIRGVRARAEEMGMDPDQAEHDFVAKMKMSDLGDKIIKETERGIEEGLK